MDVSASAAPQKRWDMMTEAEREAQRAERRRLRLCFRCGAPNQTAVNCPLLALGLLPSLLLVPRLSELGNGSAFVLATHPQATLYPSCNLSHQLSCFAPIRP